MARCERGYLCDVCGEEVAEIADSDLYLSYIVGLVDSRALLARPERHIRCNPVQAQFIVDERFPPITVEGPFGKQELDPQYVAAQEDLLTRGWRRLQEVGTLGIAISEYPLPEIRSSHAGGTSSPRTPPLSKGLIYMTPFRDGGGGWGRKGR